MLYGLVKESRAGAGDAIATGDTYDTGTSVADAAAQAAISWAQGKQSADNSGCRYGVTLLGSSPLSANIPIGQFTGSYTPLTITSNTYAVTQANDLIEVNKTTGSATGLILPTMTLDHQYNVVDAKGDAATNVITVTTPNGDGLINGAANYLLQNNNQSNGFVFDGTTTKIV